MHQSIHSKSSGFTLIEVLVTLVIIAVMAAVSAPAILSMAPNMALKNATQDLYSSFQEAKILAIKENKSITVRVLNTDYYFDMDDDGTWDSANEDDNNNGILDVGEDDDADGNLDVREKRIIFADEYGYGIGLGFGNAAKDWNDVALVPADSMATITFNSRGLANTDSAFLINKNNDICYAITVRVAGSIKTRKYNGAAPFNVNNWTE